jgi:hypothetical protein
MFLSANYRQHSSHSYLGASKYTVCDEIAYHIFDRTSVPNSDFRKKSLAF